jgi:hypothetical protein
MGLAAAAALLTIALAFIAQTPRLLSRLGLVGSRLDLRARSLTGYGLAFLLLAMGFFIAGVPLGDGAAAVAVVGEAAGSAGEPPMAGTIDADGMDQDGPIATMPMQEAIDALADDTPTRSGSSGAMGGLVVPTVAATTDVGAVLAGEATLPAGEAASSEGSEATVETAEATATIPAELLATDTAPVAEAVNTTEPTATPQPTATATLTPTPTPSPTPSPTPIIGPAARINDNTSTLSIRRTPGGEPLVQVVRGDTVLLLSGHAFYGGTLWREVATVSGVAGWVQEQFLDYLDQT